MLPVINVEAVVVDRVAVDTSDREELVAEVDTADHEEVVVLKEKLQLSTQRIVKK